MIRATEIMGNAKYPLELFQRVITVSLETMKIVNGLPRFEIDCKHPTGRPLILLDSWIRDPSGAYL